MVRCHFFGVLLVLGVLSDALRAQAPVPTRPAVTTSPAAPLPLTYDEIVDLAVKSGTNLATVEAETQAKLKALSGVVGPEADDQRKDLLIKRRIADRQAWVADRRLKMYWLAQSLPVESRGDLADLLPEEQDALLETRNVDQKLAVPLPPMSFDKKPVEEVLNWIEANSDTRIIADWPALTKIGVSKIDVVSLEIGKFDKPASQTLQTVVTALAKNLAVIDPRQADSVLISTKEGIGQLQERDRLVAARVMNGRVWTATPLLQPAAYTQVPLIEVLERMLGTTLAEVHWDRLAALGIKQDTTVSLTLGVHRIGHAFALLTDVLSAIAQKQGAIAFDLSPDGAVILSDKRGLTESLSAADWLATAVARAPELQELLATRMGDIRGQNVALADAVQYVRDAAQIDLKPDWPSLAASGLNERTTLTLDLPGPPVSQVLRLMFTPPPGKPPVTWKVEGKALVVRSAG